MRELIKQWHLEIILVIIVLSVISIVRYEECIVKDFNKRCLDVGTRKIKIAAATKRKQEKIAGG